MPLKDKVAIVTGASRGIGAAIVQTLAERGATVIASAHAADPPDASVAGLRARELHVHGRIADVTEPEQVQDLADWAREQFGRIDLLVNNAGIGTVAPTEPCRSSAGRAYWRSTSPGRCCARKQSAGTCSRRAPA